MATMNVSLPELMKDWVEAQTSDGQYANASDYVRDLIRKDKIAQEKKEVLIRALIEGEESGVSDQTIDDIWKDVKARYTNAKL